MTDEDWYAQPGEVLQKEDDGTLHHVAARLKDTDDGTHRYELDDDAHTTRSFWYEEDVEQCFEKTNVVVTGCVKPKHRLDGRLYE